MSIPKNHQTVLAFFDLCELIEGKIKTPILYGIVERLQKYNMWQAVIEMNYPITKEMIINREIINGPVCFWTIYGRVDLHTRTISEKTMIKKGKNIGRSNFTTPLTQAILEVRTKYNAKIRKGFDISIKNLQKKINIKSKADLYKLHHTKPWRIYPMALHNYSTNNNARHISYPCYIQPKLDGTRLLATEHNGQIDLYTRTKEDANLDYLIPHLNFLLSSDYYLDGEIWSYGKNLQDISGNFRKQKDSIPMEYHIFDIFQIGKDLPYEERRELLYSFVIENDYVKIVRDHMVNNEKELLTYYEEKLNEGYEGIVIRNITSPYKYGLAREHRSYTTLKLKSRFDAEYPVIGWTSGKRGKEVNTIIWICEVNKETVYRDSNGLSSKIPKKNTFSVTPNWSYADRRILYDHMTQEIFDKYFYKKLAKIQYSTLSNDFKPQQPKFLYFIDDKLTKQIKKIINKAF